MPIFDLICNTEGCPRQGKVEEHLLGLDGDAVLCQNCFDPMTQLPSLCTNFTLTGRDWPGKGI